MGRHVVSPYDLLLRRAAKRLKLELPDLIWVEYDLGFVPLRRNENTSDFLISAIATTGSRGA